MHQRSVPATFDLFVELYDATVRRYVRKVSRGAIRPDDLDDLVQAIYLRIWDKDYLDRCRVLVRERGLAFSTLLYAVVHSVCVNQFRANTRNPLNCALRALDPRTRDQWYAQGRPAHTFDVERRLPQFTDDTFEGHYLGGDYVARLTTFIATTKRGALLASTLTALLNDTTGPELAAERGVPLSRITRHRATLRTLTRTYARRVG